MDNIDEFNKAAAVILNTLYEAFPRRIQLWIPNLLNLDDEGQGDDEQRRIVNVYGDTVLFLQEEGYISFELKFDNTQFEYSTLTSKGLAILSATPDALKEKETIGKRLGTALKSGSQQVVNTLVNQIITAAAGQIHFPHNFHFPT